MGPYFAVVRDSFHSALANRVLWVAFVAIWLLLALLAPIGYREDFTTTFRPFDFHNGTRLKAMLARGLADPDSSATPVGRLAAAMPEDLRRQLERVGQGDEVRIRLSALSDALNECIEDESWYDTGAWADTLRLRELRDLDELDAAQMEDSLRRRRARLRIEAALPGVFETRASRSILVTYAGMDFPAEVAFDKSQFTTIVNQFVMPTIIDWVLGFALILLGILVTSAIIPDMLQPGSLHLLLSKPVSRTLLLISKFIGGCAFVLLCVIQLMIGLYLISGLRLDIWNIRLLWCIPVSVFLFSVFYSISVVAGLRWRSPILAIGVTTICGAIFFIVGFFGQFFDQFIKRPQEIRSMALVGDTLFASTSGGGFQRYVESTGSWDEIFDSDAMSPDRVLTPIVLDESSIATAWVRGGRFNPFGSGSLDLLVLRESEEWKTEPSLRLPTATSQLMRAGNDIVVMNTSELSLTTIAEAMVAAGESSDEDGPDTTHQDIDGGDAGSQSPSWMEKLSNMMGGATSGFQSILPDRVAMTPPRGVLVEPEGNWLIGMTRGRLLRLERPAESLTANPSQSRWAQTASAALPGEASGDGVLSLSGNRVLISRTDDSVRLYDASSLEPVGELELEESLIPLSAAGIGDERFLLVTSDGRLKLIQPKDGSDEYELIEEPNGFRDVHAAHFDRPSNRILVAHHVDQIDLLNADTMSIEKQIRPTLDRWRWFDRFILSPLRFIVPQTGELGETIAAMVSGRSAVVMPDSQEQTEVVRYSIFRPVFSCASFIVVMLLIGCVYFRTRDF